MKKSKGQSTSKNVSIRKKASSGNDRCSSAKHRGMSGNGVKGKGKRIF